VTTTTVAESKTPGTNWAGNLTYSADRLLLPSTIEEAQEAVRAAGELRVLGSRHCFNDIADTTATQLSLERLEPVLSLDRANSRVTVDGAVRYGDVAPYLHDRGYAFHNLASLPHISIAGACATATHGSGVALGNLATAVAAIEFINAAGDLVTLSRESDRESFAGAVVNLGALGVVTKLTLDLLPAFDMRQNVYCDLPVAALEANFEEIMSSGYSVGLFTAWRGDTIEQVWVKSRVGDEDGLAANDSFFGARPATQNMHPLPELDPVNCTEQMGVPGPAYERLPHFRMGFKPAFGEEIQVEYFVPREHAVAAMKRLRSRGDQLAPVLKMSEIRAIAADDLWMSPCYQQASVAFHFSFNQDWPALQRLLPGVEEALAPFHLRPHWGKEFTMSPRALQARYRRLPSFRDLLSAHDPHGKFRNAFLRRNIFADV
jgi:alditol oxidase